MLDKGQLIKFLVIWINENTILGTLDNLEIISLSLEVLQFKACEENALKFLAFFSWKYYLYSVFDFDDLCNQINFTLHEMIHVFSIFKWR